MSRVNVDTQALVDARFNRLSKRLGLGHRDHALGRMVRVWMECTLRETEELTDEDVDLLIDIDGAAEALVASELAERTDSGVRIKGCTGRTDWLQLARKNGAKGAKHGKKGGRPRKNRQPVPDKNPRGVSGDNGGGGSGASREGVPEKTPSGSGSGSGSCSGSGTAPDLCDTHTRARVGRSDVEALWSQLNEAQTAVGAKVTKPTPHTEHLALEAIKRDGLEVVSHVIRVLELSAKSDPRQRKWLDGQKTWHPNVVDNNRNESAEPVVSVRVGHVRASDDPSLYQGGLDKDF